MQQSRFAGLARLYIHAVHVIVSKKLFHIGEGDLKTERFCMHINSVMLHSAVLVFSKS